MKALNSKFGAFFMFYNFIRKIVIYVKKSSVFIAKKVYSNSIQVLSGAIIIKVI